MVDKKYLIIDLFSGLGGASESMMNSDAWDVIRIEKNADLANSVPNTFEFDIVEENDRLISDLEGKLGGHSYSKIIIWASPECKEWSQGYASKKNKMLRDGIDYVPNMSQVLAIMRIIDRIRPDYWLLENVVGGIPFINLAIGPPRLKHRPWIFWGDFPLFNIDIDHNHKSKNDVSSRNPMRYWIRSKIPFDISDKLRLAIENQTTLGDF